MKVARTALSMLMGVSVLGVVPPVIAQDAPTTQAVQVVDYRKLKELLPGELGGLKRTGHSGEKIKLGEFSIANAKAEYAKEGEEENLPRIDVDIVDYGAAPGMAQGMAGFATMDVDREGDDGYQKSGKVAGQPALETWTAETKSGTIMILVANRFVVNIQTNNLPSEQIRKIAEALPIDKLAALK